VGLYHRKFELGCDIHIQFRFPAVKKHLGCHSKLNKRYLLNVSMYIQNISNPISLISDIKAGLTVPTTTISSSHLFQELFYSLFVI